MKKNISNIHFKQGLPESENEFLDFVDEKSHIVCVFVQKQLCVNSHHYNASLILLIQNLFQKGSVMRTISLNTKYMIIFAHIRDQTQLQVLSRQMFGSNSKYLLSAYAKAVSRPYGYLCVDNYANSDGYRYRLRSDKLPNQDTVVYLPLPEN